MSQSFNVTGRFTSRAVAVLREQVAVLNRRAARLGCQKVELSIGEAFPRTLKFMVQGREASVTCDVHECHLVGTIPVVEGGWQVQARRKVDSVGVVTFDLVRQGVAVHGLEESMSCEHCNTNRRRSCVYYLRNEAGDMKRVGSTCLVQFLGCKSPAEYAWSAEAAWIAAMLEGDSLFGEGEDGWLGGGAYQELFPTEVVIGYALRATAEDGYKSRRMCDSYERPTVDVVDSMLDLGSGELTEAELSMVGKVRDAVAAMDESDYSYNVQSVLAAEYVTRKNLGIAVSSVAVFYRAQRAARSAAVTKLDAFIGSVGERLELEVVVEGKKYLVNDWGETCLYRLRTTQGHSLVWFASGGSKPAIDKAAESGAFKVRATVKRHGRFNDVRQTTVSRVAVVR